MTPAIGCFRIILLFICCSSILKATSQNYHLDVHLVDKDSSFKWQKLGIRSNFISREGSMDYIKMLPGILLSKGYPAASIDSVSYGGSSVELWLYLGNFFEGVQIETDSLDKEIIEMGLVSNARKIISFSELKISEQHLIDYYNNSGYPFASVGLENIKIDRNKFIGQLIIKKGTLYHIDSIRQFGKLKIKNTFLQHYLSIPDNSLYNIQKLKSISQRLSQLSYAKEIQKPDVTMLGTGGVVNVYLDPRRSSSFNVLVGLIPSSANNVNPRLTGEVDLDLKNVFNNGESLLVNWEQLQKQSPRLNFGYINPFIFNSNIGLDISFNLFKRDSSYVNIKGELGIVYSLSPKQSGKIFVRAVRSYLLEGGIDTGRVISSKLLPANIDYSASSIGLEYKFNNTNDLYNPRKGNEINVSASVGLKNFTANNYILNLIDRNAPDFHFKSLYDSLNNGNYQLQGKLFIAHYFPSGNRSVFKTAANLGVVNSTHLFRNELFLIGGYKILRGFDEESITASQFAILTTEYRYLTGQNAYLYLFNDIAFTGTHYQAVDYSNNFISVGLGVSFETKAGLLNFAYAIGKRNDVKFNLSEASKIHFGFVNFF